MRAIYIGSNTMQGVKNGRPYSMSSVDVAVTQEPSAAGSNSNGQWDRKTHGYTPMRVELAESAFPAFTNVKPFTAVTLITEPQLRFGELVTICVGIAAGSSADAPAPVKAVS